MYNEDRRELITRAVIGNFLKKEMSHGMGIVIAVVSLLFVIPFLVLSVIVDRLVFKIVAVVIIALGLVCVTSVACRVVYVIHTVNSGRFSVSEDTLVCVEELLYDKINRTSRSHLPVEHHDYVFRFESGKEFTVTAPIPKDETRLSFSVNHSNKGDLFYVVTLDKKPDEIVLIYSGVIFKYRD